MRLAPVQDPGPELCQKLRLPESGQKILVAVSGGVDSMVLLHLLKTITTERCWKLTVAHYNHSLRGRASDIDEAFVRRTAKGLRLPFVSGCGNVKKFAKESKLSIEMAARKLRHGFLASVARKHRIGTIALAHHADDQVELFFLRLLSGSGGGGLSGMRWRSPSPADKTISLVRPLLNVSKTELERYARENKIRYREDATNASPDFLRNRIRHELLPLLRRHYQPALNKAVLRLMDIVGAESDFAEELARSWFRREGREFEKLPVAIQRQILKVQLTQLGIAADFDLIEALRKSANQSISVLVNFSVSRDKKGCVTLNEHRAQKFGENRAMISVEGPGKTIFGGVKLQWRLGSYRKKQTLFKAPVGKSGAEFFDADQMGRQITLRHWCAGDRFQPIGLKSSVKLQDLFTNQKIPREQRHKLIVAEAAGEIFWVEGLRISENFKLTSRTKRQLVWRWQR